MITSKSPSTPVFPQLGSGPPEGNYYLSIHLSIEQFKREHPFHSLWLLSTTELTSLTEMHILKAIINKYLKPKHKGIRKLKQSTIKANKKPQAHHASSMNNVSSA